jgi:transcriptional regulator with XRE-family HTH domain
MSEPAPWQALGECLHAARHRLWLSQLQVAKQIGITQAAYSQIERGLVRPRPAHLHQLALVLSIDIEQLSALANYPLEQVAMAVSRAQ